MYVYGFDSNLYTFTLFQRVTEPLRFEHDGMTGFFQKMVAPFVIKNEASNSLHKRSCHMILVKYKFHLRCAKYISN